MLDCYVPGEYHGLEPSITTISLLLGLSQRYADPQVSGGHTSESKSFVSNLYATHAPAVSIATLTKNSKLYLVRAYGVVCSTRNCLTRIGTAT